jgi:hypothetical protein
MTSISLRREVLGFRATVNEWFGQSWGRAIRKTKIGVAGCDWSGTMQAHRHNEEWRQKYFRDTTPSPHRVCGSTLATFMVWLRSGTTYSIAYVPVAPGLNTMHKNIIINLSTSLYYGRLSVTHCLPRCSKWRGFRVMI